VQSAALTLAGGRDVAIGRIATTVQLLVKEGIRISGQGVLVINNDILLSSDDATAHGALCQALKKCTRQQLNLLLQGVSADGVMTVFGRKISQGELSATGIQCDEVTVETEVMLLMEALRAIEVLSQYELTQPSSSPDDEPQSPLLEGQ
jgi:hypothetical protein